MIIVTGGAGFIGSNVVRALNNRGIENILIVDNLSNSFKHLNLNRLKFIDFIDKNAFFEKLPKLDTVKTIFHLGACSNTTESDGKYMMENNYEYSKKLLSFSLSHKIDFLYASSAAVYGNGDNGFCEDTKCEYPLNIYAYSKYIFDNFVRRILAKQQPGSQITGIRYFNVYGYQENHKDTMASVAFHFFNQLKTSHKVKLFEGSEGFFRDFVFVEDVADVNMFFYESKKSGIYNCGTGKEENFLKIAEIVQQLSPKTEIEYIPFPEHLKGKYQNFTKADLTNLRNAGYEKPFHDLKEGLTKYYECLKTTGGYLV